MTASVLILKNKITNIWIYRWIDNDTFYDMTAFTSILTFKLDLDSKPLHEVLGKLKDIPSLCLKGTHDVIDHDCGSTGGHILVTTTPHGSHVMMHIYDEGLVTVDVQNYAKHMKRTPQNDIMISKTLEGKIREFLGDLCKYSRCLPGQIMRGEITPYFSAGDDMIFEYSDIKLLFEKDSKWQNIKIYGTGEFGNILCLDDDIMIGESDLIYTQTLLGIGRNNFNDKTVLILGGGDGGLLYELLKERPKYVLMVEIDEEVVKACRTHMRKLCESALDAYQGPNYKIQFDDCVNVLDECVKGNRKFDYVINDLSEYLINHTNSENSSSKCTYDFKTTCWILEMSARILERDGKYLSRGNAESAKLFLRQYEEDIEKIGMQYKRFNIDVPSFKETYCIYEVWRKDDV